MRGLFPARCFAGVVVTFAIISTLPGAATGSPATAPSTQPAQCTFHAAGLSFCYPAGWAAQKAATAVFDVAAPPCPSHAFADLCLDVPHLPPHFAWMISATRVESGYVKNLRQTTIPDAQVDESVAVPVTGCQQARRVKCSGHDPSGKPTCDVAVIAIRGGAVYIFSGESNPPGDPLARAALDGALATLQWTP